MTATKNKKVLLAFLIAGTILFNQTLPAFAAGTIQKTEIAQQKSDSTKVSSDKSKPQNAQVATKEVKNTKSTTNLAYNFIYYLISKFIQVNPLFRSK